MSWIAVGQTGRVGEEEEEGWCSYQHATIPTCHNATIADGSRQRRVIARMEKNGKQVSTWKRYNFLLSPAVQNSWEGTKSMVRRRIGKTLDILSKQLRTHFFILRWECRHAADSECAEKLTEEMKYLRKTDKYAQNNPRELKICVSMKFSAKI